jgi:hypothetical protein
MSHPSAPPPLPPDATTLTWQAFAGRLARTIAALRDRHFLILSTADGTRYVQFAAGGAAGLRIESISDEYLPVGDRLTDAQREALAALGWQSPNQRALGQWGVGEDEGSTNWWVDLEAPVCAESAAELAVRTLHEVHGAESPDGLTYRGFHGEGPELLLPELGLAEEPTVDQWAGDDDADDDDSPFAREAALVEEVRDALGYAADDVVDEDPAGHFHLTVHGVALRVVIDHDLLVLRVIAELIEAPVATPEVLASLNHVNAQRINFGYLYWRDGQVRYAAELAIDPCDGAQVVSTCIIAAAVVRGLGGMADPLAARFTVPYGGPPTPDTD